MTGRTIHVCVDVRWLVSRLNAAPSEPTMLCHADGTRMTFADAMTRLTIDLARGRNVLPMSSGCDNPCARKTCTGFDYSERGCPGHDSDDE